VADWGDRPNDRTAEWNLLYAGLPAPVTIDDRIEEWHNAAPDSRASHVELHEYLGMTWEEYVARFDPDGPGSVPEYTRGRR